ncbi:MAG: hypothetical protein ACRD3J_22265 [Thermoanaerobaculia bacterium]
MDANRLVKWLGVILIVFFAWKYAIPWAKKQIQGKTAETVTASNSCTSAAQRASEVWGSGLNHFVNPPYDLGAWSSFRSDVDAKISSAESECRASSQSCDSARSAMSDLRSLVSEFDSAIRNGSPPPDNAVQRQEAIDTKIETAVTLARAGN